MKLAELLGVDFRSGIEYYTNINPTNEINSKTLQNEYLVEYNIASHNFYGSLYVPVEMVMKHLETNSSYELVIDMFGENDEIKTNTNYSVKFLKSVFFMDKQKDITKNIRSYYCDFIVTGPFMRITKDEHKAVYIISSAKYEDGS